MRLGLANRAWDWDIISVYLHLWQPGDSGTVRPHCLCNRYGWLSSGLRYNLCLLTSMTARRLWGSEATLPVRRVRLTELWTETRLLVRLGRPLAKDPAGCMCWDSLTWEPASLWLSYVRQIKQLIPASLYKMNFDIGAVPYKLWRAERLFYSSYPDILIYFSLTC